MKKQWISILIVGMSFATAWAIRGQFGHEPGASWAAGIGALALVLVSQRKDWFAKILPVALASMVGWGGCGMISYGIVVGYGRNVDFVNAAYGLVMLFVIGGLFGLLGGGLVGLTLDSSKKKPVYWNSLMAEMVAGGIVGYYLLIQAFGFLMTPPRSEAWAVCLGAGLAMIWYMVRNEHKAPLRVAYFAAMGAGFGFGFGNVLQILGDILAIQFNMWNVMEYSIGFFGGSAMAYGVFSSVWPEETTAPQKWQNKFAYFVVFLLIPYMVFSNSNLIQVFFNTPNAESLPAASLVGSSIAVAIIIALALLGWTKTIQSNGEISRSSILQLFLGYWATYIFLSYGLTGGFRGNFMLNHHLYVLNFIVVVLLLRQNRPAFFELPTANVNSKNWLKYTLFIVAILVLLAFILIHLHGDIGGKNTRF